MPGPERRPYSIHERIDPYSRPAHNPILLPQANGPALDPATQAAIQEAVQEAARKAVEAAVNATQRQAAAHAPTRPGAASMPMQLPGMPDFVRVSGESDPRKVAGKLAHTCREGAAPPMLTIGTRCINQAIKAICIARGYLADPHQIELTFQTAFREGGTPDKPSVALYLSKHPNSHWVPVEGAHEIPVSANSEPTSLAETLAASCRNDEAVCLVGIGMDAVTNAVMAIGHTRLCLERAGKDIRAWPEFVKVRKSHGELNAIKFHIHVDRLQ